MASSCLTLCSNQSWGKKPTLGLGSLLTCTSLTTSVSWSNSLISIRPRAPRRPPWDGGTNLILKTGQRCHWDTRNSKGSARIFFSVSVAQYLLNSASCTASWGCRDGSSWSWMNLRMLAPVSRHREADQRAEGSASNFTKAGISCVERDSDLHTMPTLSRKPILTTGVPRRTDADIGVWCGVVRVSEFS